MGLKRQELNRSKAQDTRRIQRYPVKNIFYVTVVLDSNTV